MEKLVLDTSQLLGNPHLETRAHGDSDERIELDDWYILNFSLWNDIKIIAKTIWCVLSGKGAY